MFVSLDKEGQEDSKKKGRCERADKENFTAHVRSLKKIVQWIPKNSQELVETGSIMVVTRAAGGWGDWEMGRYCSKGTNFQL